MGFLRQARAGAGGFSLVIGAAVAAGWIAIAAAQPPARPPAPAAAAGGKKLALVGGMLLTGYEVPPIHHATIVVEGSKIVAAGPSSEVKVPPDATVVDTSGRTMLPGLIEAHGHLLVLGHGAYDTWFPWITAHGGDTMLNRVMEISARQLLMAGVTTTVDLGDAARAGLSIRDRINKGEVLGHAGARQRAVDLRRGAGGAMQAGFGGLNVTTPEEAGRRSRSWRRPASITSRRTPV